MASKKTTKKRMGRPPKVAGGRTSSLTIRLSPDERNELEEGATRRGLSVTDYIVECVRASR